MKKHRYIALHVALLAVMLMAVVAPVLLPGASPVALAYTGLRYSTNNVAESLGWSVYDSNNVVNPDHVFDGYASVSRIQNGWVIFDLGASFVVDYVSAWSADSNLLIVQHSSNAVSWSDPVSIGCFNFCSQDGFFTAPNVGLTLRYLRFLTTNTDATFNYFAVNILSDTPPTPTPFPTASPLPPQPTACVTVTPTSPATAQRTPTPFNLTPHPQASTTPGGATATPAATATPGIFFVSDISKFATSLSPWTALISSRPNGSTILAEWSNVIGTDQTAGAAFLPFYGDYDGVAYTASAPTGAIVFSRPSGFPKPIRITGDFKSDLIPQFRTNYVRIFYLSPDYAGSSPVWVFAGAKALNSTWSILDFTIQPTSTVTALVVDSVNSGTPFDPDTGVTSGGYFLDASGGITYVPDPPGGRMAGAFADNLKIYAGSNAIAGSYPVCQGTGGSGKPPIPIKQCKIKAVTTNVYAGCTAPTDGLDLAGWITYYFCRLWHYLWFVNENRAQITDILDRQNSNEPIGTLGEMDDALGVLYETVSSVGAVYSGNDYYTIDWSTLFAGWNVDFDNITKDWKTTPDPIDEQAVLNACPSTIANMNKSIQKSPCFVIWLIKIKLRWWVFFQYALDASAIIYVLSVILEWLGQHG